MFIRRQIPKPQQKNQWRSQTESLQKEYINDSFKKIYSEIISETIRSRAFLCWEVLMTDWISSLSVCWRLSISPWFSFSKLYVSRDFLFFLPCYPISWHVIVHSSLLWNFLSVLVVMSSLSFLVLLTSFSLSYSG